jgi:RNA polymerase sigma-70 factor (sigma-E family)
LDDVSTEFAGVGAVIGDDTETRIAALYALHVRSTGRLAYLLTGDPHLAEDLTQEAFTRLMGRLGSIKDDAVIASYLRRSVVNLARKHWRKTGNERRSIAEGSESLLVRPSTMPDLESRDAIWRALEVLPFRQRAAIVLRFYEDLSERQTATLLGCPVGTVKSAVSRGLERVKKEMIGDEDDGD